MPSPQAQELLDDLRAGLARRLAESDDAKAIYEEAMAEFPAPEGTDIRRRDLAGTPALHVVAPGAAEEARVLYLHGGGFAVGSSESNQDLIARLSHSTGFGVVGLDYPLLPDARFPVARDATLAAWRALRDEAGAPLAIAGSSAGGGLALSTALTLRDGDEDLPAAILGLSPWYDLTVSAPSLDAVSDGDWLGRDSLVVAAETYLDGREPTDPLASPLHADLSGLPPLLVQVGGSEILLDDASRLADDARRAGTHVELDVWPGMFHNFQLFASRLEEGAAALERAGEWLRDHLMED